MSSIAVPLTRPSIPPLEEITALVRASCESGRLTLGPLVERLEQEVCRACGVKHAVAVSSATSGLMLTFGALDFPEGAEIVVPSFTFPATVQALLWNRLVPVYTDCLPGTMTIDPDQVRRALGPKTVAVCPVNIFGLPPDYDELEIISRGQGIPLVCDDAQGLGSTYHGRAAGGFGLAEVFSLSPTKVVTAWEGGMVTTDDGALAERLRAMRDYGKGPAGDMLFNGLSARMSEFHAATGLLNLGRARELVADRLRLIRTYRERLQVLAGCRIQEWPSDRTSSGNYFTILIGSGVKANREQVITELAARRIETKRYFHPPVHVQELFRRAPGRVVGDLNRTVAASAQSLALPLFSHMDDEAQSWVCRSVEEVLG